MEDFTILNKKTASQTRGFSGEDSLTHLTQGENLPHSLQRKLREKTQKLYAFITL